MPDKLTPEQINSYMSDCTLCPRECHADRAAGMTGFCGQTDQLCAARAALHFWEEPCISSECGSGAVFFSGCNLQCVYCQNHEIALGNCGRVISADRLCEIFLELQGRGAANINLVTGSHFIPQIAFCLEKAKKAGLVIPVVYNTGSYEKVSSLRLLAGLVDVYLPDLKYYSPALSLKYSGAEDYFEQASAAISEMYRQVGSPVFDEGSKLIKRGVIVRHLLLPGQSVDSKHILRYLHNAYGNDIYVSIMNQYTPLPHVAPFPELNRRLTPREYEKVLGFADAIGIEKGFMQEGETARESFIPAFNEEGL